MREFSVGDRIRIDIPDETDPEHETYHGEHGQIVSVLEDDAETVTDDMRDSQLYRIKLDTGEEADFRWRDLRPPVEDW
jgi:ribosomal protein L21E